MTRLGKEEIDHLRSKVTELLESKEFILFFVYPPEEGQKWQADVINNLPKERMKAIIGSFWSWLEHS